MAPTPMRICIMLRGYPDSITTLAQCWHCVVSLADGYPLAVLSVDPTLGQSLYQSN